MFASFFIFSIKYNSGFEILFVLSNPQRPRRDGGNFVESRQFAFSQDRLRSELWIGIRTLFFIHFEETNLVKGNI